jgi:hypothetical protein
MFLRRIRCRVFDLFNVVEGKYVLKPGILLFQELFTRGYSFADSLALRSSDEELRKIVFGFSFEKVTVYVGCSLFDLAVKLYHLFVFERLLWVYYKLRDSIDVSELFSKSDAVREQIMIYICEHFN